MPHDVEEINPIAEPKPEDIGFCTRCDIEIVRPESAKGLCAHCSQDEVAP